MIAEAAAAILIGLGSYHQPNKGYCQTNPGVLVQQGHIVAGAYYNSLCRTAVAVHWHQPLVRGPGWSVGVQGGLTTGYGRVPLAGSFRADLGPVVLFIVPPLPPRTGPTDFVIGAALKLEW